MNQHPASKRVSFAEPRVLFYKPEPVIITDDLVLDSPEVTDLIPRERLIHRSVARKAVLSMQDQLRTTKPSASNDNQTRLAEFSAKFTRRAKDIALELARVNCLEVYGDKHPDLTVNLAAPVTLTEFPEYKIVPRRVTLDGIPAMNSKRKRAEL